MPRNETIITIFLASPSDVQEERKSLEYIVSELNKTWSKTLNTRFELLKWETDVYPNFGAYSQDVINKQINDEYDIFIGLFWSRIGSPTPNAESGTIEEFNRAFKKYTNDNSSVDILMYFKDEPISPSKIDYEQMSKIKKLKDKLGELGGLYWQFNNADEFESLLRSHLSKVAQKWSKSTDSITSHKSNVSSITTTVQSDDLYEDDEDLGYLDYQDIYEERMAETCSALNLLTEAANRIGIQFEKRTNEVEEIQASGNLDDNKHMRKLLKMTSDDLDRFSESTESQIKIASRARAEAFHALSKILALSVDFSPNNSGEGLSGLKQNLVEMNISTESTKDSILGFQNSIAGIPRMTVQLNKSKRRALDALSQVVDEIITLQQSTNSVVEIIDHLIA